MAEYVVLIEGDADRWWTTMDTDERAAGYAQYDRFGEELARRGHRITGGAQLHATSEGKRLPAGGGQPTDGPFTEVTEQVGGFYQVESEDLDDLVDCCQILAALGDRIEVRRVVKMEDRTA